MREVRHLLCDLDGTLVDVRQGAVLRAFAALAVANLTPSHGLVRATRAVAAASRALKVRDPDGIATNEVRVVDAFARALGTTDILGAKKRLDLCLDAAYPRLARYFRPLAGADAFVDWARTRFPLTLATNPSAPRRFAHMRLGWAGIDPTAFGYVTSMETSRALKPARDYFTDILHTVATPAATTLLVGNDMRKDLAATHAGIAVFIVEPHRRGNVLEEIAASGDAPAWRGTFGGLRQLLGESA